MVNIEGYEAWFTSGSQHLYGEEALAEVAAHAKKIAGELSASTEIPVKIVFKPVVATPGGILDLCKAANAEEKCIGLILWMHTFSPAKMWIRGLSVLQRPFLHLHTQFNRDIPWETIDMDFMNLNQSAHGGREFGFIGTRMGISRKVVVGHWEDPKTRARIGVWTRAACAWRDSQGAAIARFGDNMREVAVTEGDKVDAQIRFGYSVNGYAVGDLAERVSAVPDREVDSLADEYDELYDVSKQLRKNGEKRASLRDAARIELGMRGFLQEGGFTGFTTTFENLHGLAQLPGLASQRLMAAGYGFGAEGDWKTAALVRAMKVMAAGSPGGTSFMEDYTYHLDPSGMKVLGAHMLEVCASIAAGKPSLEIHPLSIGGKADPPRLVFDVSPGSALNVTIIDLGDRFRMIANNVTVVEPERSLPRLPVARAVWVPAPDLPTAAACWILAGGAHHAGFSKAITADHLMDFAEMAGIEFLLIDEETKLAAFRRELRWNEAYYRMTR